MVDLKDSSRQKPDGPLNRIVNRAVRFMLDRYSDPERIARLILGVPRVDPIVLVPATDGMVNRICSVLKPMKKKGKIWRYTGLGSPISLCPTGVGAPSTEIITTALIAGGARILLRFDVCGGMLPDQDIGHLFVAHEAIGFDGVTPLYSENRMVSASQDLATIYETVLRGDRSTEVPWSNGTIATVDFFFAQTDEHHREWSNVASALDMETAAIYAIATANNVQALSIMTISDIRLQGKDAFHASDFNYMAFRTGMKNMLGTITPFLQRLATIEHRT